MFGNIETKVKEHKIECNHFDTAHVSFQRGTLRDRNALRILENFLKMRSRITQQVLHILWNFAVY